MEQISAPKTIGEIEAPEIYWCLPMEQRRQIMEKDLARKINLMLIDSGDLDGYWNITERGRKHGLKNGRLDFSTDYGRACYGIVYPTNDGHKYIMSRLRIDYPMIEENAPLKPEKAPISLSDIEKRINTSGKLCIDEGKLSSNLMLMLSDLKMLRTTENGFSITELGKVFGIISIDSALMFDQCIQRFIYNNLDLIGTTIRFEHCPFNVIWQYEDFVRDDDDLTTLVRCDEKHRLPYNLTDKWSPAEDAQLLYLWNYEKLNLEIICSIMRQNPRVVQHRYQMLLSQHSKPYYYRHHDYIPRWEKQFMWINPWMNEGADLPTISENDEASRYSFFGNTKWNLAIDCHCRVYRYDYETHRMIEWRGGKLIFSSKFGHKPYHDQYFLIRPFGPDYSNLEFNDSSSFNLITTEEYDDYTNECYFCAKPYSLVYNLEGRCPFCGATLEEQQKQEYYDDWDYAIQSEAEEEESRKTRIPDPWDLDEGDHFFDPSDI